MPFMLLYLTVCAVSQDFTSNISWYISIGLIKQLGAHFCDPQSATDSSVAQEARSYESQWYEACRMVTSIKL
jgi:hypothetical protein